MKLLILHLNLDFRKTRNVQNRTPYPKAKSQKEEEILNVLIDLQIKNSCNRNKYVSRNKLLLCPHIKVFILSPISNRHWSLPEVSRMPRRLDIPDNTITQSSKHTIIHSKFKIYLTDLNELLLVKSPIAIVIQSCKKFPRSFSFSHAIIKIGKHHYRFHSIKWKKKDYHLDQSCACSCPGPAALSELFPTPLLRPRLQTTHLRGYKQFETDPTFFFSESSASSTAGVVTFSFLS